jgi:hypothetical protein
MRFLFVYQDRKAAAQELLAELVVHDVALIVVLKNSTSPNAEELALLEAHKGAPAAACELVRKYRKNVAHLVSFTCEPKKFRIHDQQLRAWLVPKVTVEVAYEKPSLAFAAAANRSKRLLLHPNALDSADDVARHRWRFAAKAADLLGRYANGEDLGPNRDWKAKYGVEFAASGRVEFRYHATCGSISRRDSTAWHLKEGDTTTRESAVRIYFAYVEFPTAKWILVFYVGPHPPSDGERKIMMQVPEA